MEFDLGKRDGVCLKKLVCRSLWADRITHEVDHHTCWYSLVLQRKPEMQAEMQILWRWFTGAYGGL